MSPRWLCMPFATLACVYRFGVVEGANDRPRISEPIDCSHRLSQPPLKPVCPVSKTFLPHQNASSISISIPLFPGRLAACPQFFEQVLVPEGVDRKSVV